MLRIFPCCLASFLVGQCAQALDLSPLRSTDAACSVWGQVIASEASSQSSLVVELTATKDAFRERAPLIKGSFEFGAVPAGVYNLRVLDLPDQVISTRTGWLSGRGDRVVLRPFDARNSVSVKSLNHHIRKEAMAAFQAAERAARDGDTQRSIEYLRKAVEVDPRFAEAQNNLAVHFSALGQDEQALSHATTAFQIDPDLADAGYTLSVLLTGAKRYEDAATVTRKVLKSRPQLSEVRALLVVNLIHLDEVQKAYHELRLAAADFPMARLLAANALIETGWRVPAWVQVNEYLRSTPPDCERRWLSAWLAKFHTLQRR